MQPIRALINWSVQPFDLICSASAQEVYILKESSDFHCLMRHMPIFQFAIEGNCFGNNAYNTTTIATWNFRNTIELSFPPLLFSKQNIL